MTGEESSNPGLRVNIIICSVECVKGGLGEFVEGMAIKGMYRRERERREKQNWFEQRRCNSSMWLKGK